MMFNMFTALTLMQGVHLCIGREMRFLGELTRETRAPVPPMPSLPSPSPEGEGEGEEEEDTPEGEEEEEDTPESGRTTPPTPASPESPSLERSLIYEALQLLNPNTLNLTIYWSCISKDYTYLEKYGEFQKGDETYISCEGDGHFLFERSCLHNMLVPLNCLDGTWNCGSKWLNNVEFALQWIHREVTHRPQCYGEYNKMPSYALTWDCEERCDLPCDYSGEFCSTVKKSYNFSECKLDCAVEASSVDGANTERNPDAGRLLSEAVHAMTLIMGNLNSSLPVAHATPSPSAPVDTDGDDGTLPAPPKPIRKSRRNRKSRSGKSKNRRSRGSRKTRKSRKSRRSRKGRKTRKSRKYLGGKKQKDGGYGKSGKGQV